MSGLFVTLEGGEGTGKSTQAGLLAASLRADGHAVLQTREPGGSPGAERLRALLLQGDHALCLRAEILLVVAARVDHLERVVLPALERGAVVVCDRFGDSTTAYQGYGLGRGEESVLAFIASLQAVSCRSPDLTLLLDMELEQAQARAARRGAAPDRYERLDQDFHARVADGFRRIAAGAPGRVVTIDASLPPDAVQARLLREVRARIGA